MRVALFDDLGVSEHLFFRTNDEVRVFKPGRSGSLDDYFAINCEPMLANWSSHDIGVLLFHANGMFLTDNAGTRQQCQGVDLLKFIRLSSSLSEVRHWHAFVYSFELTLDIIRRQPRHLIVLSPGVTVVTVAELLEPGFLERVRLSAHNCAQPDLKTFRPYVACDFEPSDSAHDLANRWGAYSLLAEASNLLSANGIATCAFPKATLSYVNTLSVREAVWLDQKVESVASATLGMAAQENLEYIALKELVTAAAGKKIIYLDDEALTVGWAAILDRLLMPEESDCTLMVPTIRANPNGTFRFADTQTEGPFQMVSREFLCDYLEQNSPDLLILDLRLGGGVEVTTSVVDASGMQLALKIRNRDQYLPILLFTASNKAETLLAGNSLDVDDYWMKPGLGEHRSIGGDEGTLIGLANKIHRLLGDDFSWLQSAAKEVRTIKRSTEMGRSDKHYWWQRPIETVWSVTCREDKASPKLEDIRDMVVQELHGILYAIGVMLRFEIRFLTPHPRRFITDDNPRYTGPPETMLDLLKRSIYNHIGEIVEQVHGRPAQTGECAKKRGDLWGYLLYKKRNDHSHARNDVGEHITKQSICQSVSDCLAWLTCDQTSSSNLNIDDSLSRADLRKTLMASAIYAPLAIRSNNMLKYCRDPKRSSMQS